MWKFGLAAAALLTAVSAADAKPKSTTSYSYYSVSGDSAVELYDSMVRRGPHVNGSKAYASTAASAVQEGKLMQGTSCRVSDYRLSLKFTIRLPKLRNEAALSGETKGRWRQFSAFLKRHEETHRSIWLECAQALESKVASIRTGDCRSAEAKAVKMWDRARAACLKRHDAFDAAEQRRLIKHPFVRMVLARAAEPARGAVVKRKKRRTS
jgi:predicted secreted Zn-dependent protease